MANIVDVIYNRYGNPELRVRDDGRLLTFGGLHIGFLKHNHVYDYSGVHKGWYEGGILRDNTGYVVGFGEKPTDYPKPILPIRQLKPLPNLPSLPPLKPLTQLPPLKPLKSFYWSSMTPISLLWGTNG